MLKIIQVRLQQYMNQELPNVQTGFKKGRRTKDQIANICWIIEKAREFQKNIYFCFSDYTSKPGFSNTWTENFQMFNLVLEKAEKPEIKLPVSAGPSKKQESARKTSISALLTTPKPSNVWITINCGKFWKMGIPDHLTCLLRNLYAGQEATVRTGHGTQTGSK